MCTGCWTGPTHCSHASCSPRFRLLCIAGTSRAVAVASGVATLCLASMADCELRPSPSTCERIGSCSRRASQALRTPPASLWFTRQAKKVVYRCMTTGSALNKGVTQYPGLLKFTQRGGALNATEVVECCRRSCNVPGELYSPG
jgi:hypothetical protein